MPVNVATRDTFNLPPGQTFTAPTTSRDLHVVRHRTLDFDVWTLVTNRGLSNTFFSPCSLSGSSSPQGRKRNEKERENEEKTKTLILGPTRQQTEIYFKKRSQTDKNYVNRLTTRTLTSRLQGLAPRYPYCDGNKEKRSIASLDLSLLESKINDPHLHGTQARLRDSVTDIATSSILSRRSRIVLANNERGEGDIKFFADLVKPMQYRWKRDNERVLLPSKHGYHPRSQSPTFKRLIEVTEKLERYAESEPEVYATKLGHDSGMCSLIGNVEDPENKTRDQFNKLRIEALLISHSQSSCSGTGYDEILSPRSDRKCSNIGNNNYSGYKKDDKLSPRRKHSLVREEDEELLSIADSNYEPPSMEDYFKVDFRVQKSHAELHLFLPQIDGRLSQSEKRTRGRELTQCAFDKTCQVKLPSIDITQKCESFMKGSPNASSRKLKRDAKKKKKTDSTSRARSVEKDNEINDRLNDVPTLISIENEKDHVHSAICPFNPCTHHINMQKNHTALM